jgi:hypothetical protein
MQRRGMEQELARLEAVSQQLQAEFEREAAPLRLAEEALARGRAEFEASEETNAGLACKVRVLKEERARLEEQCQGLEQQLA